MPPLELLAMEFKRYPMALSKFSPPSRLRDVLRETETSSCWHMPGVHVKGEGVVCHNICSIMQNT